MNIQYKILLQDEAKKLVELSDEEVLDYFLFW